jgi:hypothetical protein
VERSKKICRISKTAGSKTLDIGPKRKRVKFENNRTTFDPRTGPLKITIFGPKTLFLCKPLLRSFKHQWRPPCCKKKPLTLLVFMKKCFLPIENRSTGSPGPLKWARSPKNLANESWIDETSNVGIYLNFSGLKQVDNNQNQLFSPNNNRNCHARPRPSVKTWRIRRFWRIFGVPGSATGFFSQFWAKYDRYWV